MGDSELRERILNIALNQFMSVGYRTLRTDDLASDAGISKKTLYRLFREKKEILFSAIDLHISRIETEFVRIFEEEDLNFVDQFSALMEMFNTKLIPLGTPLLTDMARTVPEAWSRIEQYRRTKALPRIEHLIIHGIDEGYIRQDIDPHLFILLFTDIVQATITPQKLEELGVSLSMVFRMLQTIIFEGLLTQSGRSYLEKTHDKQ